jgi:hypothetical protein
LSARPDKEVFANRLPALSAAKHEFQHRFCPAPDKSEFVKETEPFSEI